MGHKGDIQLPVAMHGATTTTKPYTPYAKPILLTKKGRSVHNTLIQQHNNNEDEE